MTKIIAMAFNQTKVIKQKLILVSVSFTAGIIKVGNGNTRIMYEIYLELTIKTMTSLLFLLFTLNISHALFHTSYIISNFDFEKINVVWDHRIKAYPDKSFLIPSSNED